MSEKSVESFFKFTMHSLEAWKFDHIIQPEGEYTLCKGCIYKMIYEHYRKKVLNMRDLIEKWSLFVAFCTTNK